MARTARTDEEWEEIAEIGARLRQARTDAGITQVEMAERLNVTQPNVSDWERGIHLPDPRLIVRWAEETEADLRDLLVKSRCISGLPSPAETQLSFPEPPTLTVASSA